MYEKHVFKNLRKLKIINVIKNNLGILKLKNLQDTEFKKSGII